MKKYLQLIIATISCCFALTGCNSGGSVATNNQKTISHNGNGNSLLIQNGSVATESGLNGLIPLIYHSFTQNGQSASTTCSGTLLDSQTILTAAHCVLNMNDYKPAGQNYTVDNIVATNSLSIILPVNLNQAVDLNKPQQSNWNVYHVASIYVHQQAMNGVTVYGSNGFNINDINQLNDIAILKLDKPVAAQYQFATLATNNPQVGDHEIIAGFGMDKGDGVIGTSEDNGASNVLRYADSIVQSSDTTYLTVGGIVESQTGYTKICDGDSGGPDLLKDNTGKYIITGIHSFNNGSTCGISNTPSTSISIAHYIDWINGGYLTNSIVLKSA